MKLNVVLKPKLWKAYIILPAITLFCLAGFIASLLFPNEVLDTYVINMEEEEGDTETLVPLSLGSKSGLGYVYYQMDTGGRAMKGIQVGIAKRGMEFPNTTLVYAVREQETHALLSENRYAVADGEDLQYVYLPFANSKACKGKIRIDFYLEGEVSSLPSECPCLVANHRQIEGAHFFDGNIAEGVIENPTSLKCSYIYSHDTYPFLYDFRIMTFVFLACSMAVSYPALAKRDQEKKSKADGGRKRKASRQKKTKKGDKKEADQA